MTCETKKMTYLDIRNDAYNILCKKGKHEAWLFLSNAVDNEYIDKTDARCIFSDIMELHAM